MHVSLQTGNSMYVCTVNKTTGFIVWKGTAFNQCPDNEIILLNHGNNSVVSKSMTCNDNYIVASLFIANDSGAVSQVTFSVTSDIIGKTVTVMCYYDDGVSETLIRNFTIFINSGM